MGQRSLGFARRSILRVIVFGTLLLLTLGIFVPWKPELPQSELDSSWEAVLHWAHGTRLTFGRDLIFTYGPWGFINQGYSPQTFGWIVAGWTLYATTFFAALIALARRARWKWWWAAVWIAVVLGLTSAHIPGVQDAWIISIAVALLLVHFCVDARPITFLKLSLTFALALASLGKFSLSMLIAIVMTTIAAEELLRKKLPALLGIYSLFMVVLWMAAGQPLGALPSYFRNSLRIASGFAQGGALYAPNEGREIFLFFTCGALFVMLVLLAHLPFRFRPGPTLQTRRGVLLLGCTALIVLILFKSGYVRHDGHAGIATVALALIAMVQAPALWAMIRHRIARWMVIAVPALCIAFAWHTQNRWFDLSLPRSFANVFIRFPARISSAIGLLTGHSSIGQQHQAEVHQWRESRVLPNVRGSVDVFPWAQRVVLANGLDYHPRPVFQSYFAYTASLAQLNADFFAGPNAAESVLFDIQSIDEHLPSMEDGLCWPELWARYELVDARRSLLLLQRSTTARAPRITQIVSTPAALDQWVKLPDSTEPIWAAIQLRKTLSGKLRDALYKPPQIYLELKSAPDRVTRYRLSPDTVRGGFLVSPQILDRMSFALLGSTQWADQLRDARVSEMRVTFGEDQRSSAYAPQYDLSFSALEFVHRDLSAVPGVTDYLRFREFMRQLQLIKADARPQTLALDDGRWILVSPHASQFLLATPGGSVFLRISFGVLPSSQSSAKSAAVQFRAFAVTRAEQGQLTATPIWADTLDPLKNAIDAGLKTRDISLPYPIPPGVLLEIAPADGENAALPFWADARFR